MGNRPMRAVVQRVSEASVIIDGSCYSRIGRGLLVLLGVQQEDTKDDLEWLAGKIARLRVFPDDEGV
ncbi:MAG: D-aminoacyl-tRNA deacylase, partial [Limisphaera sp.]|nr:D-aminoacyl-tRNA deacylase [Limisphaera sp.]